MVKLDLDVLTSIIETGTNVINVSLLKEHYLPLLISNHSEFNRQWVDKISGKATVAVRVVEDGTNVTLYKVPPLALGHTSTIGGANALGMASRVYSRSLQGGDKYIRDNVLPDLNVNDEKANLKLRDDWIEFMKLAGYEDSIATLTDHVGTDETEALPVSIRVVESDW